MRNAQQPVSDPKVCIPTVIDEGKIRDRDFPGTFLVCGIPQSTCDAIFKQRIWSCSKITFEARRFDDMSPPTYLFAITGLRFMNSFMMHDVRDIIQRTWSELSNRAEIVSIIQKTDLNFHDPELSDQLEGAVQNFIDSIVVGMLDYDHWHDDFYHHYTVAAKSPTSNFVAWTNIRNFLMELHHMSPLETCSICHTVSVGAHGWSHWRGCKCPFHDLAMKSIPRSYKRRLKRWKAIQIARCTAHSRRFPHHTVWQILGLSRPLLSWNSPIWAWLLHIYASVAEITAGSDPTLAYYNT
ncbi:hypothetical protein J3A83DRAFT_4264492 [Scleroderma citrinum]